MEPGDLDIPVAGGNGGEPVVSILNCCSLQRGADDDLSAGERLAPGCDELQQPALDQRGAEVEIDRRLACGCAGVE